MGEHVAGIGEEGKAARHQATDHFNDHDGAGQDEGQQQVALFSRSVFVGLPRAERTVFERAGARWMKVVRRHPIRV